MGPAESSFATDTCPDGERRDIIGKGEVVPLEVARALGE
jgi:hypothetical protein